MNRLKLVFVGELKAPWARQACGHYLEALARYARCDVAVLPDAKGTRDIPSRLRREGQSMLAAFDPRDRVVGLDERGKAYSSKGLAEALNGWLEDPGRLPCFVIGGAYGYAPEVSARFDTTMSLGPYTLPHELARVVLAEQLYRAMTILAGHPYHHG